MSNNQLDTTTQDKKEQNLQLIANSLQAEMAKDFLKQTENYDNKFKEIFDSLYETQELLLLSLDESKKASMNLSQIEIDARISKTLEDFEFTKKSVNGNKNFSSWFTYIIFVSIFLVGWYYIK